MKVVLSLLIVMAIASATIFKEHEGCIQYSLSDWNERVWQRPDPEPIFCCSKLKHGYAFYYPINSMAYGKDCSYLWIAECNPYCEDCPDRYTNMYPQCINPKIEIDPNCDYVVASYGTKNKEDLMCWTCKQGYIKNSDGKCVLIQ